ncbi:hypothetical protein AWB81_06438 [Caballeronia arationis]|uniref:hypothetical protein n=1 Tax=Caballeronia arationis TaxID=1777142 RepID=UPI00074D0D4A|nr:hypothetical protein [Caballeronia arationis]SAL03512.1 hypothetical protein AWB81_06438 [Caballeronia arationis]
MKPANYGPVYCALYPQLAEIARKHGWALAIHGSLARDFDLVCIPWTEKPGLPAEVVTEITESFAITTVDEPNVTHHGRERWTLSISFGECAIDLSFMPRLIFPGVKPDAEWRDICEMLEVANAGLSQQNQRFRRQITELSDAEAFIEHLGEQHEFEIWRKKHGVTAALPDSNKTDPVKNA